MYGILLLNFLEWSGLVFWVLIVIGILLLVWAFQNAEVLPTDMDN